MAPGDIVHLAEPLRGIADRSDPAVADFLSSLGGRLANLMPCAGLGAVMAGIEAQRPDYVLVGQCPDADGLAQLAQAVRTATIGLVILRGQAPGLIPIPHIEIEALPDGQADLNVFSLHVRGLMRRCRPVALKGRCRVGRIVLDEAALTLTLDGDVARLSLEDFRLLGPLFDIPGRVWSRKDLLHLAYGVRTANAPRTVDVKLNRTRRRLRAALDHDPIRSVRGAGYTIAPD